MSDEQIKELEILRALHLNWQRQQILEEVMRIYRQAQSEELRFAVHFRTDTL